MHYDDPDMRALWRETQEHGAAIVAYLTGPVADYTYTGPDHEATPVMVSGHPDGDQPGTVVPGTVNLDDHGFPYAEVIFDDGSTFGFHAARLAPYTPIRYGDDGTVMCAVCHA